MKIKYLLVCLYCSCFQIDAFSSDTIHYNSPGVGNPLVPGYFADPTIKKFGDTYYLYATTDGVMLASGAPQVWISKDFVNWYNYKLDIPMTTGLTNCWAPDVLMAKNGKYYYYQGNCETQAYGCSIWGYVSDNPTGPWARLNSKNTPVIPRGKPRANYPSLDAQFLQDGDSLYAYYGTWCSSNGGMGFAKVNADSLNTVESYYLIPTGQLPEVFEGAYPMKKNDKYILMYSSGDCQLSSYRVQYAYADKPRGPYKFGSNNPILSTSADGKVDGPGHHSVLEEDGNYFMVYHRHDNPHSGGGEFRQVCADTMFFENDSTIRKINPSYVGVGYLDTTIVPENIAFNSLVTASSFYHMQSKTDDYVYYPSNAIDDNNGTMWKAADNQFPQWLTIDLGSEKSIKRVMTEFEYTVYYYQYKIELSTDSITWNLYADKTSNKTPGCPMIDDNNVSARYMRITITGAEKSGFLAAIWNVKVYSSLFDIPAPLQNAESLAGPGVSSTNSLLVNLNVENLEYNTVFDSLPNLGVLGGIFKKQGSPKIVWVDSFKVVSFSNASLRLSTPPPASLDWNSSYSVATWVKNPAIAAVNRAGECLASWCNRNKYGLMNSYASMFYSSHIYGAAAHLKSNTDMGYKTLPKADVWHHLVLTFDGMVEKVYVDGVLDNSQNLSLSSCISGAKIIIGSSDANEYFSGYMASLLLYDKALTVDEISELMSETMPKKVEGPVISSVKSNDEDEDIDIYYDTDGQSLKVENDVDGIIKSIKMYSIDGRIVKKFNKTSKAEFNLQFAQKGIYIAILEKYDGKIFSKKLLVY